MSDLHALVYHNGARYRLAGVSHDDSGSHKYYTSLEDLESAVTKVLSDCQKMEQGFEGALVTWLGSRGEEHFRVEARQAPPGHH